LYIDSVAPGRELQHVRRIAKVALGLGNEIKHRTEPDGVQAGVAADAVVLLVSMVRRLATYDTQSSSATGA